MTPFAPDLPLEPPPYQDSLLTSPPYRPYLDQDKPNPMGAPQGQTTSWAVRSRAQSPPSILLRRNDHEHR